MQDARWQEAGVEIENIALPAGVPGLFHVSTTRRLVQRALDFQPDVIHCFKPKAYAGLAAWWLWQLKRMGRVKARLIVDTDDWEGAGGWNDLNQYSWAQKKMFAWQEQWGLTHNDGVTVASKRLAVDRVVAGREARASRVRAQRGGEAQNRRSSSI